MGVYDIVVVACPRCGEESEFQSKGGACLMRTFQLDNAPYDVLTDVNRHGAERCGCGCVFYVGLEVVTKVVEV